MNVKDLDGREHSWSLGKYVGKQRSAVSEPHKLARELLNELYPFDPVLEEVHLPGTKLHADFYVNSPSLMVEVHGEQHYSHNYFFFKNKKEFYEAQARDRQKEEWCRINDITLVVLNHKDTVDEWRDQIKNI